MKGVQPDCWQTACFLPAKNGVDILLYGGHNHKETVVFEGETCEVKEVVSKGESGANFVAGSESPFILAKQFGVY